MKNYKKICKIAIVAVIAINTQLCFAEITPHEASSTEYLINKGYSKESARLVQLNKQQISGEKIKKPNIFVRFFRKVTTETDLYRNDTSFGTRNIE